MRSTQEVIDSYLEAFETGSPDKVLELFSDESIVICGDTVYKGLEQIRGFFEHAMRDVLPPDAQIDSIHDVIEDDIAYFVWSSKATKSEVEVGVDTILVKDGVITRQTAFLGFG